MTAFISRYLRPLHLLRCSLVGSMHCFCRGTSWGIQIWLLMLEIWRRAGVVESSGRIWCLCLHTCVYVPFCSLQYECWGACTHGSNVLRWRICTAASALVCTSAPLGLHLLVSFLRGICLWACARMHAWTHTILVMSRVHGVVAVCSLQSRLAFTAPCRSDGLSKKDSSRARDSYKNNHGASLALFSGKVLPRACFPVIFGYSRVFFAQALDFY